MSPAAAKKLMYALLIRITGCMAVPIEKAWKRNLQGPLLRTAVNSGSDLEDAEFSAKTYFGAHRRWGGTWTDFCKCFWRFQHPSLLWIAGCRSLSGPLFDQELVKLSSKCALDCRTFGDRIGDLGTNITQCMSRVHWEIPGPIRVGHQHKDSSSRRLVS